MSPVMLIFWLEAEIGLPVVVLLSQRTAWTMVPRVSARVSSTNVTSFRSSLKISFFFSIDEVHRLRLIN